MALRSRIHRKLFQTLEDEMTADELASLKSLCQSYLPRGKLDKIQSTLQLLDALEKKGCIGLEKEGVKYGILCEMFSQMDNVILLDHVKQAETQMLAALKRQSDEVISNGPGEILSSSAEAKRKKYSAGLTTGPAEHVYERGNTMFVLFNQFTVQREGTIKDERNLLQFFEDDLNYTCHSFRNCSKEEMITGIEEIAQKINSTDISYKRLFVIIMSHGDENGIKTCLKDGKTPDGESISPDQIFSAFTGDKIPNFAGCPKVFLIQACRGHEKQRGVHQPDEQASPEPLGASEDVLLTRLTTPVDADMLVGYSQTQGYVSWRVPWGSWFLQEVAKGCKEFYKEEHLIDILTIVNRKVASKATSMDDKQMPCLVSTLTKKLYL